MSDDSQTQETIDLVCAAVERLQIQTTDQIKSARRRRRVISTIGFVLAAVSCFALWSVTSLTKRLDASAAVQIARIKVEEYLPSARLVYQERLEQEAPRLVGQALHALIEVLPRVRSFLVADLGNRLDELNEEFEARAMSGMLETVHASKTQIEGLYPDKSTREKLELLISTISSDFGTLVSESNQELYPHYSHEMDRIRFELRVLRDTPDEDLTEEQRIKREIILTLMHLAMREATAKPEGHAGLPAPFSGK